MAVYKLYYQHPADNLIGNATITVPAGAIDALYPVAYLFNGNPALPCKCTGLQARLLFDFGSPVSIPFAALIHHNLTVAARWEANDTTDFTTPALSEAFAVATLDADGYRTNLGIDVSAATGYAAYRYWSLVVDVDNGALIVLGELWLGSVIRSITYPGPTITAGETRPDSRRFETNHGVRWTHAALGRRRNLHGEILASDAEVAALTDCQRASGNGDQPMIVIPDAVTNEPWLAFWDGDQTFQRLTPTHATFPVAWLELARGPAI